jgi:hypothetical protein
MFKKYDCTNDDGTYDAYNSCYLHDDKKGFNFFITNDTVDINIFVRTKENLEGKFETNVQVKEQDSDGPENSRHNITFTSEEPVNIENIYENFNDEFSEGSNKNWDEIFDEYSAFAFPEKVKGNISNSDIWNELKNENNVDLVISENWNYNGWGNYHNHYIKNEKEDITFRSENDNDFSYEERTAYSDGKIEIEYENYNGVPDFKIEIDKNNNISFNGDTIEKMIEKKVVDISKKDTFERNSEKIEYFIDRISERMPITQLSMKATQLFRKSLRKAAKKIAEQKEVKSNKNERS